MITEKGEYADLVDMVYLNVPQFGEKKIVDFLEIAGVHPYETANVEMLKNLLPFFTTISNAKSPSLYFHLPLPEYLIHGVSIFLAGNMTLESLDVYANLLINYASVLQQKLLANLENVKIHFSSPLEILIQDIIVSEGCFTNRFFKNIGIPLEKEQFDRKMGKRVAVAALEYLKSQQGIAGLAWARISEQAIKDGRDLSLKCLADWSNAVHLVLQSAGCLDGEVALVDDCWERRIVVAFKKYFQTESCPSIQCFHWLMPVGKSSISTLSYLPVNPDGTQYSTVEIERMFRVSSNRISKHGVKHSM